MKNSYLLDDEYLSSLNDFQEREVYAKIISLDIDENPIEEITGNITQGSISLDGTSAVRRTCSLTMVAQDININDYYWGLNTKIKIYIGIKDLINEDTLGEIVWFPQGIYIITTFSTSQSVQGYTINLQGKDKMCLLNGDIGGVITAISVDFGKEDIEDEDEDGIGLGTYTTKDYLIKDIIKESVHEYAKEPYHNIVINDLDDVGLELMEYRGKNPMYLIIDYDSDEVVQMTLDGSLSGFYSDTNGTLSEYTISTIPEDKYDTRNDLNYDKDSSEPLILYTKINDNYYPRTFCKIEYGETVGYRVTDITYAGDLIGSVGQSITTVVLDPIVKQLGNFEYFYDTDGRFIFQKKKTYIDTSWNNLKKSDDEVYGESAMFTSSSTYHFENSNLITSFNNNPDLNNVKNDFAIWGTKTGISGAEIPIHIRYAIDKKPIYYKNIEGIIYTTESKEDLNKNYEMDLQSFERDEYRFGLSEDWWEVREWARAWVYSGLEIPTQMLGVYCKHSSIVFSSDIITEGQEVGKYDTVVDAEEFNKWWPDDNTGNIKHTSTPYYSDDIVFNKDGKYYDAHGGCCHTYTWWLEAFNEKGIYEGGYAYFYQPEVPTINGYEKIELILDDSIIKEKCDWREIIYQMASDYFKYRNNENFFTLIAENNPDFYPDGKTGYEQYYTDIYSFWRDLYDPSLGQLELYNYTKVYDCLEPDSYPDFEDNFQNLLLYKGLYYKKDGKYEKISASSSFNKNFNYFIRKNDIAEKHLYKSYYILDSNNNYVKKDESDITNLTNIYNTSSVYYKQGSEYYEYELWDGLPESPESLDQSVIIGGSSGGGDDSDSSGDGEPETPQDSSITGGDDDGPLAEIVGGTS